MKPLSKIIVIIIMSVHFSLVALFTCLTIVSRVRGRHRGLPLAVDRAVLLPSELVLQNHNAIKAAISAQTPVLDSQEQGQSRAPGVL